MRGWDLRLHRLISFPSTSNVQYNIWKGVNIKSRITELRVISNLKGKWTTGDMGEYELEPHTMAICFKFWFTDILRLCGYKWKWRRGPLHTTRVFHDTRRKNTQNRKWFLCIYYLCREFSYDIDKILKFQRFWNIQAKINTRIIKIYRLPKS